VKVVLKIVLTNWINFLVIFIALWVAGFLSALLIDNFSFSEALFETVFALLGYGMPFWISFFIFIGILDIVLFSLNKEYKFTIYKLAIEWLFISSPYIFWLIKYHQWIFLVGMIAFLTGQYLRKTHIYRILAHSS
jgi:hypothetical protein